MLKLLNRDLAVPVNGDGYYFRYRHSENGHWSEAFDYYTWQHKIRLHRQANGLPTIEPEEAEDQLCRTLPPGWCTRDESGRPSGIMSRFGWSELVEGMKAFAKVVFTGFVEQKEAERRATICSTCYFNVNPTGCGTCQKMATLVSGEVARRKTPYDASLKACAVCQCSLAALIHFPIKALNIESKQDYLPDFCFQKIGGENFVPA